ncbi:hypothetical protein ACFVGM_35995 [Kitasatospora purpeofusca]
MAGEPQGGAVEVGEERPVERGRSDGQGELVEPLGGTSPGRSTRATW